MNCESVLNCRSISFLNSKVPEMLSHTLRFALNFGQSNTSRYNGGEMWKVCTLGKKNWLLPCSSLPPWQPKEGSLSKIRKGRGRGLLSPCGWFTTKVCYAMICSPLFSRKNLGKTSILFLECQRESKQFEIQSAAFEQNTYSFPVLVLKVIPHTVDFYRAGNF